MQTCKQGHYLAFNVSSVDYMAGMFTCDVCHKNYPCGVGRYNCDYCKFDICQACQCKVAKTPATCNKTCGSGHPLHYNTDTTGCTYHTYSCSICKNSGIPCASGRWTCYGCNYNVCVCCIPHTGGGSHHSEQNYPPAGSQQYPYPTGGHSGGGHQNAPGYPGGGHQTTPGYPSGHTDYPSGGQGQSGYVPNPTYYPSPSPSYPPSRPHCPPPVICCKSGHPLYPNNSATGYWNGSYTCCNCMGVYPCNIGRYCCTICKYDVCKNCKPY